MPRPHRLLDVRDGQDDVGAEPIRRTSPQAVLFDVDFTIAKPGPLLGPEGYSQAGEVQGLSLDPARYAEARAAALVDLEHHPELDHDEEIWVRFTEDIIRGMGGGGPDIRVVAEAITAGWLQSENFELYEDAIPTLELLREHGLKVGLVSNTSRDLDAFIRHFALEVDAWVSSGSHGKVKPSPTIFRAALDLLEVEPADAVMVGDSPDDDVEGARALGMPAFLLDREGRFPERADRLADLFSLPTALGLRAA
jgi:HAD superfamily hydrolase (TIGR01662 family)